MDTPLDNQGDTLLMRQRAPRVTASAGESVTVSVPIGITASSAARLVAVPANAIADSLGNVRMANMVALGAYVAATGVVSLEMVEKSLERVIAKHYSHLIPKNAEALRAGAACKG